MQPNSCVHMQVFSDLSYEYKVVFLSLKRLGFFQKENVFLRTHMIVQSFWTMEPKLDKSATWSKGTFCRS